MYKIANEAFTRLQKDDIQFKSVLDVGCGNGEHTRQFREMGCDVTSIDHQKLFPEVKVMKYGMTPDDYYQKDGFDLVWTSHVLEHQMNTLTFLQCMKNDLKEGGWLCTTVPPLKHKIVGGHVTLWNAGLLLYNLVMAGFDCSNAKIKTYGYNISIINQKKSFELPDNLHYDIGDIEKLKPYFPPFAKQNFDGRIEEYNW
jgi:SAM-dependent methyltransferase